LTQIGLALSHGRHFFPSQAVAASAMWRGVFPRPKCVLPRPHSRPRRSHENERDAAAASAERFMAQSIALRLSQPTLSAPAQEKIGFVL
jgi:hypothetical protein